MRMAKIKSKVSLRHALEHNTRTKVPENANPERLELNESPISLDQSIELYDAKLPKKVRKNAVHAVEVVLTASPEWFDIASNEDAKAFTHASIKWCSKIFGADNILSVCLHRDEKTPHLHVIAMPLVDGKLNAKELIGGTKHRMAHFQDDFYKDVGAKLGLDRGIVRAGTKHTKPKELGRILAEKIKAVEAELEALKAERDAIAAERKALEKDKKDFAKDVEQGLGDNLRSVFHKWKLTVDDSVLFWKAVQKVFKEFQSSRSLEGQNKPTAHQKELGLDKPQDKSL